MKRQLIKTADGSHSFYMEEMDEQYHSKHGAIAESNHIFIQTGLVKALETFETINIFEVGMGTGLNVFLTALKVAEVCRKVTIYSIEAYPIDSVTADLLNYPKLVGRGEALFSNIHQSEWEKLIPLNEYCQLYKTKAKMQDFSRREKYSLIYFDAFAPEKQNEMWTIDIFEKLYNSLVEGGILVTYCVKGSVRRILQSLGFQIEKLEGPKGGKREILRAIKLES